MFKGLQDPSKINYFLDINIHIRQRNTLKKHFALRVSGRYLFKSVILNVKINDPIRSFMSLIGIVIIFIGTVKLFKYFNSDYDKSQNFIYAFTYRSTYMYLIIFF